ncbi:MAG: transposase family protein [Pikeienuella sp.]
MGQIGTPITRCCDGERLMPGTRKTDRLLPSGLVVDDVLIGPDEVVIAAHAAGRGSECPNCGRFSRRVHSRYERCLSDLPAHGRRVQVRLSVRRFRCPHSRCPRKIFAERPETARRPPGDRDHAALWSPDDPASAAGPLSRPRPGWPARAGHGPPASCPREQGHASAERARAGRRRRDRGAAGDWHR